MTAVEVSRRAVNRNVEPGVTAHPEDKLWLAVLMDRTVADEPEIDFQRLTMSREVVAETIRPRLLLAFEDEDQVGGRWDAICGEGIEGREDRRQRCLVVAGRPTVDAPLGIDGLVGGGQGPRPTTDLDSRGVERRLPGWGAPLLRVDRLAVVVDIEAERAIGADVESTEYDRWGLGQSPQLALDLASC